MPSRRAHVLFLCLLISYVGASATGLWARQAKPTEVVPAPLAIDFIALQADGAPVTDLRASEVEVRLNGKARKILSIRRVSATDDVAAGGGSTRRLPSPYASNEGVGAARDFVLLVDQESFAAGREQLLRNAVDGLLPRLSPADRAMVLALPFGGIMVDFTSDHTRIREAVAGVTGQGSRGETGTDMGVRTRRFLESLVAFLQTHRGRTTPLTVILFTAGMSGPRRDAPVALQPGQGELLVDHFRYVGVAAGAARANFYLGQPADLAVQGAGWSESISGANFRGSDNPLEGVEQLSGATGGTRLSLDAAGTDSLVRIARETAAHYVADVEVEQREVFGRSRPLSVKVTRAGVTVRSRPEITFAAPTKQAGTRRLEELIVSGGRAVDLPLHAAAFTVRESEGRLRVGVVVEPADSSASLASVAAILIDADGRIAARWLALTPSQRPLLGAMAVAPGTYRLRVAAIDSGGRCGVVEDGVEARLTEVGPISLGSLMLGISREGRVVPQLEFGNEPSAIASFDLYGGAAGMGLAAATMELARDVEAPPVASLPLAFSRADASRVVATATLPLGALAPGDYVVRGVIQLQDGTRGQVMRTLRKAARQ
ncbi:MAG: hypothetical protein ACM3NQ_11020 [Bacteroidales bacterium]